MFHRNFKRSGAVLAALLASTTAAQADVSAGEVWDAWKKQMSIYGETGLTIGTETMDGDTLTVDSLSFVMTDDNEYSDMSVAAEMGPIMLTENGDGSVSVTMPDSYPVVVDFGYGDTITVTVSQENMSLLVTGTPEAMNYDLSADRYGMEITDMSPDIAEEVTMSGALWMNDVTGSYQMTSDNLETIAYSMDIGSVEADVTIAENGGDGRFVFAGDVAAMTASANIAMPVGMSFDEMDEMPPFAEGFAFDINYGFGQSDYAFSFQERGDMASGTASLAEGLLELGMDIDGINYATRTTGLAVTLNVPRELPPIDVSADEASFGLDIPLSASDSPQDTSMGFALRGLEVGDVLWSMIDPGQVLPRDPANVVVDLTGQVTPLFNFLDPADQMNAMMSDMPVELQQVSLNELTISVAGAEVLGSGAFTFDNTDLTTFDGLPRPMGELTINVNGANGLIDKLVQMGLVPEDQAMMPRMMMGMFATSVGDDMLETKLEINEQGHVLANGQRLQ